MKLNRNNYEEYFLLYTDNELSLADRKLVEDFVTENPDLFPELDILLRSKLTAEPTLIFENKESLLKQATQHINETNYETYQLSFVDNELNDDLNKELQSFNFLHPVAQQNQELLLQTKFLADTTILYPGKEFLLSENIGQRKRASAILPYWLRLSAAAVILLALSLITFNQFNSTNSTEDITAKPNTLIIKLPADKNSAATGFEKPQQREVAGNNKAGNQTVVLAKKNIPESKTQKQHTEKVLFAEYNDNTHKTEVIGEELNLVKQLPINGKTSIHTDIALSKNKPSQHIINNSLVTPGLTETYYTQSTETNDLFIYAAAADERSNKTFRGIFRKATRIFERTTNINATDGEDKLLIGGIAINLK